MAKKKKKTKSKKELDRLYKKYEDTIEELANKNKYKYFTYFGQEDIKQEVRNICYNALRTLDESLTTAKTYLTKSVTTRLNNFKRDNYYRYENPCVKNKCPMYNIFTKECTSPSYMENCPIRKKNDKKMQAQINVNNLSSLEEVTKTKNEEYVHNVEDGIVYNEIKRMAIAESGALLSLKIDLLSKYGTDYISEDEVNLIEKVVINYVEKT